MTFNAFGGTLNLALSIYPKRKTGTALITDGRLNQGPPRIT